MGNASNCYKSISTVTLPNSLLYTMQAYTMYKARKANEKPAKSMFKSDLKKKKLAKPGRRQRPSHKAEEYDIERMNYQWASPGPC